METAFIIFGGTMFWILAVIFFAALVTSIECDNGWVASTITIVIVITLLFGVDINVFVWIWNNPILAFEYFAVYFIFGAIWGVGKWWYYCRKLLNVARDYKVVFLNNRNISDNKIPDDMRETFGQKLTSSSHYTDIHYPPQALHHKSDWLMWATWWPVSFFWTMLNQPIKNIWLFIYVRIGGMMQRISNHVFKEI